MPSWMISLAAVAIAIIPDEHCRSIDIAGTLSGRPARSQMVNLMAHAAKVALSRNPEIVGHWRSECIEFHDRLVDAYRPSMHDKIDMASLWRRATRKVAASFADHGEAKPQLPQQCPFSLNQLVDPDLDLDELVATVKAE